VRAGATKSPACQPKVFDLGYTHGKLVEVTDVRVPAFHIAKYLDEYLVRHIQNTQRSE